MEVDTLAGNTCAFSYLRHTEVGADLGASLRRIQYPFAGAHLA
jgi:hypothetical protein